MIIIWGFKARWKVLDRGYFQCPAEQGERVYSRKQARKWFTFFWIPLIPLDVLGEVIECESCRQQYNDSVLSLPTTGQMHGRMIAAASVLLGLTAHSTTSPLVALAALGEFRQWSPEGLSDDEIEREWAELHDGHLQQELRDVSQLLTPSGAESLLSGAIRAGMAPGRLEEGTADVIRRAGSYLGMTPAHVAGIIQTVKSESQTPGYQ